MDLIEIERDRRPGEDQHRGKDPQAGGAVQIVDQDSACLLSPDGPGPPPAAQDVTPALCAPWDTEDNAHNAFHAPDQGCDAEGEPAPLPGRETIVKQD